MSENKAKQSITRCKACSSEIEAGKICPHCGDDPKSDSLSHKIGVIVSARNVSKEYNVGMQKITALNDVSLDIHDRDFITIQGPSGCGKTTLLNMIGIVDVPSSGSVVIKGSRTKDMSDDEQAEARAKNIGFVYQFYNLIDYLSALDNVAIACAAIGIKNEKERRRLAGAMLSRVGLLNRSNNIPGELSGGEKQRVAIARALVNKPKFLIADEPTGDLDTDTGKAILDLIEELNTKDGVTVVIVTHDPSVAARGKRQIKMRDYKIVADQQVDTRAA
jgi:putative ABC transport system ATP-binding protein